ncbi:MAG: type VI secretion system tube protein Hcp [Candidatus Eisenbacteria bacterium]|uniref:Type VI secretion system tube protein Hcp n=1 Tax=Eiseniibacteriota bacterium TaxID=2212470 RepID=A0A7Y2E9H3_UNCEI|nr:type VI secretion system tube protein Hcp [Candidatus Eisenbacteria bacterium]
MILLKFATEIKGDSTVADHVAWITCDSFQLGVGRSISLSGGGADRETSNPSFSEATFAKSTDMASSDLFLQAIAGQSLGKAEVHFIQTGGTEAKGQIYLIYELDEAIVSSYSISSGGERPSESFSINFVKISMQYNAFDGKKITTGTPKKWDLKKNEVY